MQEIVSSKYSSNVKKVLRNSQMVLLRFQKILWISGEPFAEPTFHQRESYKISMISACLKILKSQSINFLLIIRKRSEHVIHAHLLAAQRIRPARKIHIKCVNVDRADESKRFFLRLYLWLTVCERLWNFTLARHRFHHVSSMHTCAIDGKFRQAHENRSLEEDIMHKTFEMTKTRDVTSSWRLDIWGKYLRMRWNNVLEADSTFLPHSSRLIEWLWRQTIYFKFESLGKILATCGRFEQD